MFEQILVIGSGAREAAMLWRLTQENPTAQLHCAPGNAGIAESAIRVPIKPTDTEALTVYALEHKIGLTIVGPEAPLVAGIVDRFEAKGLLICGPNAMAAHNTEGSKVLFKRMLQKYEIPTAPFRIFDDFDGAVEYVNFFGPENLVIKADGLAGGKGVYLPNTMEEARARLHELMIQGIHDWAGKLVVIEDRLTGYECSATAITDGRQIYMLPLVQDYKRALDGAKGPNTGGMGARTITLPPGETSSITSIMEQVVNVLTQEECFYRGFIYLGLMMTEDGPMVLESSCRKGDPETQVLLTSMGGSFTKLCAAAAAGDLSKVDRPDQTGESLCVVMASNDYPEPSFHDFPIYGIGAARSKGAFVFHAGTGWKDPKYTTNNSGRVLSIVGSGPTLEHARGIAYAGVEVINANGGLRYRGDIGIGAFTEHRG